MRRTLAPFLFILAGVAIIVFHRYIADNAIRTYKMFRIPLIIRERDMPYYWIAIGVSVIFVGTFFLFDAIGRF